MTVETYFTMNARIVAILRQGSDPMALYAAQRIEELERTAGIRDECLETAVDALKLHSASADSTARHALNCIRQRLAELEPGESTQ